MVVGDSDPRTLLHLPPGFRFYPTDEELLIQYLCKKIAGYQFPMPIIGDVDLYKFDAWDLPNKALFGEKEWYFFSPRDRKYPNGSRRKRVAGGGYWEATGTDKIVTVKGRKVGIKKALVFYIGKAQRGTKTSWIMHEYRLSDPPQNSTGSARLDDWVLCRVYKKKTRAAAIDSDRGRGKENIQSTSTCVYGDVLDLDSLLEINDTFFNLPEMDSAKGFDLAEDHKTIIPRPGSGDYFDWSSIDASEPLGPENVQAEDAAQAVDFEFSGSGNDVVGPATILEDEIQSGRGCHLLGGLWDPLWPNYSAQDRGFGFLQ